MSQRPKIIIDLDRTPAMIVGAALFALAKGRVSELDDNQLMVVEALRRQVPNLADATLNEISDYLAPMSDAQLLGLTSAVKGIYHELAFAASVNGDDDGVTAELFGDSKHPGADVFLIQDGEVIQEFQLKAIQDPSDYLRHMERYPEIEARVTEEVARMLDDLSLSSKFSNAALSEDVADTFANLTDDSGGLQISEALGASIAVSAALSARKLLVGKPLDRDEVKRVLGDLGVGGGVALSVASLIELL